jgi:hypothetical protein
MILRIFRVDIFLRKAGIEVAACALGDQDARIAIGAEVAIIGVP